MDDRADDVFEDELDVVEHPREAARRARVVGLLLGAGGLLALVAAAALGSMTIAAVLLILDIAAIRLTASGHEARSAPTSRALVRATRADGITTASRRVPATSIASAYHEPLPGGRRLVRCRDGHGRIVFEAAAPTEARARALLATLGHEHSRRRVDFRIGAPHAATPARRLLFTLGPIPVVIGFFLGADAIGLWHHAPFRGHEADASLAALVMWFATLASMGLGGQIEVGTDGVLIRWAWRRRFLRYADIRSIEARSRGVSSAVVLILGSGERVLLATPGGNADKQELARDTMRERIAQARDAVTTNAPPPDLVARISRGGRSLATWRADLGRLRADAEGYREAAPREEALWTLLEDPSAPEDARAAAALLLRSTSPTDEDEVLPRLRLASQRTASPRLRVAIETASDPNSPAESVEDTLTAFDDDLPIARRSRHS